MISRSLLKIEVVKGSFCIIKNQILIITSLYIDIQYHCFLNLNFSITAFSEVVEPDLCVTLLEL